MKLTNLTILFLSVCLFSCAELEKIGEQAAKESVNRLATRTARKVQNKIENKIENTIDSIGVTKPIKRKSETDSLNVVQKKSK